MEKSFDNLLNNMRRMENVFGGAIAASAATLLDMGERERGSVLSTIRRNTEFLESSAILRCLETSSFDLSSLKRDEKGVSVYLVLPEWRFATHSRWLRIMITSILHALERTPKGYSSETGKPLPPVLMILEEFSTLGHLESIARAAGYIAGFGVKLWPVLQDLTQLKAHYPASWETFLANAGVITAFANTDLTTTEYLSKRLGKTEITRIISQHTHQTGSSESGASLDQALQAFSNPQQMRVMFSPSKGKSQSQSSNFNQQLYSVPLMTPDEVSRYFAREQNTMLVLVAGAHPIRVMRLSAHRDPFLKERAGENPFHRKEVTPA